MKTIRLLVSGKVQGVFYRRSTSEKALSLNLSGYAKNLPCGDVEIMAQGTDQALNELHQWSLQGPSDARVDKVKIDEIDSTETFEGFKIY